MDIDSGKLGSLYTYVMARFYIKTDEFTWYQFLK